MAMNREKGTVSDYAVRFVQLFKLIVAKWQRVHMSGKDRYTT